jgi:MOSC domain-containing protein YiiM
MEEVPCSRLCARTAIAFTSVDGHLKVISVNLGHSRTVDWNGRSVTTAFFKEPVMGKVKVKKLGLEGDEQADLKVHGGPKKAVYAYPSEHYDYWRKELPGVEFPWGSFGENLSVKGLSEDKLRIGDRLEAGSAELKVTRPRLPCFKMNVRFQRDDMMKRFQEAGLSGFYLEVLREGELKAGDKIKLHENKPPLRTVLESFLSQLPKE